MLPPFLYARTADGKPVAARRVVLTHARPVCSAAIGSCNRCGFALHLSGKGQSARRFLKISSIAPASAWFGGMGYEREVFLTRPAFLGPFVCVGCCSQLRIWHDFGNRSYVSGLLIGSRAVAVMGLRTRLGLISGKVLADHKGRQTLGAYFLRSMLSSLSRTPFGRGKR
ncbi:hypothetical protein, partial [Pseudotabrizicola sp.]|uniref:hypothetical protein n=1 Tax=Pseudotabrizicola sp. TaxID=2939647 RepID=UPI00273091C4